jgi:hypothetical protein
MMRSVESTQTLKVRMRQTRESEKPLVCGLLAVSSTGWMTDLLFCCSDLDVCALDPGVLGLRDMPNPYRLRVESSVQIALVCTNWYRWVAARGEDVCRHVFKRLERAADTIVGIEGHDTFELGLPPDGLDVVEILLKPQGLFRDRDLYNYEVGTRYPGANWSHKLRRRAPGYSGAQLDKLRLSLPCFTGIAPPLRRRVREIKPEIGRRQRVARNVTEPVLGLLLAILAWRPRNATIHFVGGLTHATRVTALERLRGYSGRRGITRIPENVFGTRHLDTPLPPDCRRQLVSAIDHKEWVPQLSRFRFLADMQRHRAVIAAPGYGELTFRHGEALAVGATLVCPSLEHVETMFPFENGHNVLFCSPDFSDLPGILDALERDDASLRDVGRLGHATWREWLARMPELLGAGISRHLRETVN